MVLLIDANVILDVLLDRKEFVRDSVLVWKLCETERAEGYISALTFANMMYIMRKQLTPEMIADVFSKLDLIFYTAALNRTVLRRAAEMKWKDFEDAIQSATAEQTGADYIITRNVADYTGSRVKAITPAELLEGLQDEGKI